MPDSTGDLSLPFRLGSTSYVHPAGLAENAVQLGAAGLIQDMELVLFEVEDGPHNIPTPDELRALAEAAARYDLTYTVHLTRDLLKPDALQRAERVIAATADLPPHAVVAHVDGEQVDAPGWEAGARAQVERVMDWLPDPALLAVENLETYDHRRLEPVYDALPVSRTLDIGHLWKRGLDPLPVLADWLPAARVVHLHGFDAAQGRDHLSLAVMPPDVLDPVVAALAAYRGVMTLEVFEDDFFTSRAALLDSWRRVTAEAEA